MLQLGHTSGFEYIKRARRHRAHNRGVGVGVCVCVCVRRLFMNGPCSPPLCSYQQARKSTGRRLYVGVRNDYDYDGVDSLVHVAKLAACPLEMTRGDTGTALALSSEPVAPV